MSELDQISCQQSPRPATQGGGRRHDSPPRRNRASRAGARRTVRSDADREADGGAAARRDAAPEPMAPPQLNCDESPRGPLNRDDVSGLPSSIEALSRQARDLRHLRRRAKKQLSELRQTPAPRRPDKVRGAYRRFRSRLLAEQLIAEAQRVVSSAPTEALSFASLVPLVLDWARGEEHADWAPSLVVRAFIHEANALRVSGNLAAADQIHQQILWERIPDLAVQAEVLSLRGSLRLDQHRFEAADEVLGRAAQLFEQVGDTLGQVKVQIKQANLMQRLQRTDDVLRLFSEADARVPADSHPHLKISTLTGRVNALCDLDRPAEARRLLHGGLDVFEVPETPFFASLYRFLAGRVSLGLRDYGAAESFFRDAANTMRLVGRHLDAASTSLYLAEALLAQGQVREIQRLAVRLIQEFRQRQIHQNARKALHLFQQAVVSETLSAALLLELRQRIVSAR